MDPNSPSAPSLTRLDRSLRTVIDRPDDTPSRRAGIPARTERLHRLHGTSLIFEAAAASDRSPRPPASSVGDGVGGSGRTDSNTGDDDGDDDHNRRNNDSGGGGDRGPPSPSSSPSLGPSTVATACAIFHRFYHSASLTMYDVWSVAMASTLLATKLEEDPKTVRQIVDQFASMYARRLMVPVVADPDPPTSSDGDGSRLPAPPRRDDDATATLRRVLESPHIAFLSHPATQWSSARKETFCIDRLPQQLNKFGPVYEEWYRQISTVESTVLRRLGFTLYWIPDSHPHKFILYFCQALELKDDQKFTQRAWNYCNDSCRLDLSVRFPPEVIAGSAVLLAARDFGVQLPCHPRPWWEVFVRDGSETAQDLATAANAILGLCRLRRAAAAAGGDVQSAGGNEDADDDELEVDWLVASKGFVPSLVPGGGGEEGGGGALGGGFNDPGSFLWEYQKDLVENEMQLG